MQRFGREWSRHPLTVRVTVVSVLGATILAVMPPGTALAGGPGPAFAWSGSISASDTLPVEATPTTIDFGSVAPGLPTASQPATLTNVGVDPVTLGTPALGGPDASAFEVTADACGGATLAASETCEISVRFTPPAAASFAAALSISIEGVSEPPGPLSIPLAGSASWSNTFPSVSGLHAAAPTGTQNGGGALARTQASSTSYLHAVSISRKVGTKTVHDAGPYSPVVYTRSGNGGSTWSGGTRLNASSQHGLWPGMAASSHYVYAEWVRVAKVNSWSRSAARSIWFRRNTNHGAGGSWATAHRLTSATGRVDYPSIAAAGANVYIAYTNANTGSVRLLTSRDHGRTWTSRSLGTTTLTSTAGGRSGLASVAASGNLVVVAWLGDRNGAVRARVSSNGGSTWGSTALLASANLSYPSAAAGSGRVGVAFIGAEPSFRIWRPGGWGPTRHAPNVDHTWLVDLFGPALVLPGTHGAGIAFAGCVQVCDVYQDGTHVESYYIESPDDGVDWYWGNPLPIGSGPDGRPGYDSASVVAASATRRDFTLSGYNPGTTSQRLYHRSVTYPLGIATVTSTALARSADTAVASRPLERGRGLR
jgi:hypothetical protein